MNDGRNELYRRAYTHALSDHQIAIRRLTPKFFNFFVVVGWLLNSKKKYSGIKWCACMLASQPTTTTKKPTPAKFNIFRIYFINYEKKHNRNQAN